MGQSRMMREQDFIFIVRKAQEEAEKGEWIETDGAKVFQPTQKFKQLESVVKGWNDPWYGLAFVRHGIPGTDVKAFSLMALNSEDESGNLNASFAIIEGANAKAHCERALASNNFGCLDIMISTEEPIDGIDYKAILKKVEQMGPWSVQDEYDETPEYSQYIYNSAIDSLKKKIAEVENKNNNTEEME